MNRYALEIYKRLAASPDWVSGEEMAAGLGISRAAVSGQVARLREAGFDIAASSRRGYLLTPKPLFNAFTLRAALDRAGIGTGELFFLEETGSTNLEARRAEGERGLVVARRQTGGRGRKGRSFSSGDGGLWFSFFFRPRRLSPFDSLKAVLCAGLAVTDALRGLGIPAGLKWPNDVLVGGKKVCGILCEMVCSADEVQRLILGIGVNVNNFLPPGLTQAANLRGEGKALDLNAVAAACVGALLQRLDELEAEPARLLEDYRTVCLTVGRQVTVTEEERHFCGLCTGVDDDGFLRVRTPDGEERVITADVTVRPEGGGEALI